MDWKVLSLSCASDQVPTLLWPLAMYEHSYIRQELACYRERNCNRPTPALWRSAYTWPEVAIKQSSALEHILRRDVSGP